MTTGATHTDRPNRAASYARRSLSPESDDRVAWGVGPASSPIAPGRSDYLATPQCEAFCE